MSDTTTRRRVLIMAGGTGGHVIPALSLARALQAQGVEVAWLGSPRGIENRLVPEAGIPLHRIAVAGLRGNGCRRLAAGPLQPDPCGMAGLAGDPRLRPPAGGGARRLRQRARRARRLALAAPAGDPRAERRGGADQPGPGAPGAAGLCGLSPGLPGRAEVVGNPVRGDRRPGRGPAGRRRRWPDARCACWWWGLPGGPGTQRAACPRRWRDCPRRDARGAPPGRTRQGGGHPRGLRRAGVEAEVSPFIDDMAEAYAWADLVVCRPGALTVAELAAAAKPALFVPFPHAVDDHQTANARRWWRRAPPSCCPNRAYRGDARRAAGGAARPRHSRHHGTARARACAHLDAVERLVAGCMETGFER
jgi:UDP-N-acetylglucosamine--N-acetylmuramyl-(pentapeptide) pyrophosphoryl-undecaprenol N-acetylglucosamine transferase